MVCFSASDICDLQIIKSPAETSRSTPRWHPQQPATTDTKVAASGTKSSKPPFNAKTNKYNGQKVVGASNGNHKIANPNGNLKVAKSSRRSPATRHSPSGYSGSPQFGQPLTNQKQGRLHGSADSLNDIVQITSDHGSHVPSVDGRPSRVRANSCK